MLYVFYIEADYLLQTFATALLSNSVATAEVICKVFLCLRNSETGAVSIMVRPRCFIFSWIYV